MSEGHLFRNFRIHCRLDSCNIRVDHGRCRTNPLYSSLVTVALDSLCGTSYFRRVHLAPFNKKIKSNKELNKKGKAVFDAFPFSLVKFDKRLDEAVWVGRGDVTGDNRISVYYEVYVDRAVIIAVALCFIGVSRYPFILVL